MSLIGKLLDLNARFAASKSQHLINDLVRDPSKDLRDNLYSMVPNMEIEGYPSCICGQTKYEANLGKTCPKCNTKVEHRSEQDMESVFYISKPAGIKTFLNPKVYLDLVTLCSLPKVGFNPIYFLTISSYTPSKKHKAYKAMQAWEIERSWDYFVEHIEELVPRVFKLLIETTSRKWSYEMDSMLEMLKYDRELIYCDYLPVLNKLILAIEQTGDIKRKSPTTELYGLAITDLISLPTEVSTPLDEKALRRVNNVVGKAYKGLDEFFEVTMKREGKKGGLTRSDTLGLRSPNTLRAVVTSIVGKHKGDDIHLPWTASTYLFEPYILKILGDDMKMSPNEAMEFIAEHRRVYNGTLDDIFQRIVASFSGRGAPVYNIRYPSLYFTSGTIQYVQKIKTDPEDKTISLAAAGLPGYNGDKVYLQQISIL